MKARLKLTAKIFNRHETNDLYEAAVEKLARKLYKNILDRIKKSPKRTGNVYRIKMPSGRYKKHVASARGEPPAILTKTLLNSIKIFRLSRYSWRISVEAPYAEYLDSEQYLGRPFFESEIKAFEKEFYDTIGQVGKLYIED